MFRFLVGVLILVAASAATGARSVVVPAEFREVVTEATLIVRGRVTGTQVVRSAEGEVSTVSTVNVSAVLKGSAGPFVSVLLPGGRTGRYRTVMTGAPRLELNDAAVFFLKRGPDAIWRPVGLAMGIFRVQPDRATGRLVIRPPVLANRTASAGPVQRGDSRRTALAIPEFDALVRFAMSPPAAAQPVRRVTR